MYIQVKILTQHQIQLQKVKINSKGGKLALNYFYQEEKNGSIIQKFRDPLSFSKDTFLLTFSEITSQHSFHKYSIMKE